MKTTAFLARSITWKSSKHSYLTARLLADRDLANDCLLAYAYFRWADDMIDITCQSDVEREAFVADQQALIESLYRGEWPTHLYPEERLLADLIAHDRGPDSGLKSFIFNFMAVISFDAGRKGRPVSRKELDTYTSCLATAVMDGLLYFIGNGHPYPKTPDRILAVTGAHITHMLRDTLEDIPAGIINISSEDLQAYGIPSLDVESEPFRNWVRDQVKLARRHFQAGKEYINSLDVLRSKLAGVWYCARFERILDVIERDGYHLRQEYPERHSLFAWTEMVRLGFAITVKHVAGRLQRLFPRGNPRLAVES